MTDLLVPLSLPIAQAENGTDWPDAAIAIAGIAMVIAIAVVVVIQIFATARARMSVQREAAYRKLAEESAEAQRRTAAALEVASAELERIRVRTGELERVLKAVE